MQLQKLTEAMIDYMGGDARRIQHFTKVHAFANLIGKQEGAGRCYAVYFGSCGADPRYWHQKR